MDACVSRQRPALPWDGRRTLRLETPLLPRSHLIAIFLGGLLVAATIVACATGATQWLSLQAVLAKRQELLSWSSEHLALAVTGFVVLYVAVAAVALPGAAVLSLLAGFLFGRWLGTLLVLVGATVGAAIVFSIARSTLGEPLRKRAGPLYERVSSGVNGNAVEILLFLRLVPLFPFFLVNLAAALFDIRLSTFLLTTAVGIAPAAFIYNSVGRDIGTVSSLSGLLTPGALAGLMGLAGLSLLPILLKQWRPWPGGANDPVDRR